MTSQWQMEQTESSTGPSTELELYRDVSEPTTQEPYLQDNNLGLGKYTDREYWQQIQAFQDHLFADSAFSSTLSEMAIYETQWELALEAIGDDPSEAVAEADSRGLIGDSEHIGRRQAIQRIGEDVWESLAEEEYTAQEWQSMNREQRQQAEAVEQMQAIQTHAGTESAWIDPFAAMISARHEASRSKDAHLIDNLFGRVREQLQETKQMEDGRFDDDSGGILG